MRSWNPAVTNQIDDPLDSLAGAISDEPIRIGKSHNKMTIKKPLIGEQTVAYTKPQ